MMEIIKRKSNPSDSKTITFKYDGDLLVSSTTPKEKYINTDMIMDY